MKKRLRITWYPKVNLYVTCSECGRSVPEDELYGGMCYSCRMEKNYPTTR